MSYTHFIGIDPGIKGAFAFYDPASTALQVFDMPTTWGYESKGISNRNSKQRRSSVDASAVSDIIANFAGENTLALIEEVHSMPNDGAVQAFAFGRSYGVVLGVLAAHSIVVKTVRPAVWKSLMNLSCNKAASIGAAVYAFPRYAHMFGLAKHDGRAEASMLALFGEKYYANL